MLSRNPVIAAVAAALLLAACGHTLPAAQAPAAKGTFSAKAHLPGELALSVLPEATDAPILQAIAGAQKSIKLTMYLLTHRGVMDALIAAKGRGLAVYVLLEHDPYNPGNPNSPLPTNLQAAKYLAQGGVEVHWTSKAFKYTHAKGLIIDDQVMWLSTANFTKSGLGVGGRGSREYLVADRSPSDVYDFASMFAADWAGQPYTPTDEDLIISPANSRAKILGLINSAKTNITLAVEVAGDPAFDQAIAARIKAGVKVRALLADLGALKSQTQGETPVPPVIRSNADVARDWRALGAEVRFQQNPHLHAKSLVVDGRAMYVGSVNFTTNSMDNNREFGLLIQTADIVGTVQRTMEKDWVGAAEAPSKK